jgi:hypothetical protein
MKRRIRPLIPPAAVVLLAIALNQLSAAPQSDFSSILLFGTLAFAGFFTLLVYRAAFHAPFIIALAAIIRIASGIYAPQLSDDYFRFWWDGKLIAQGENPFLTTPQEYAASNTLTEEMRTALEKMNSPAYHTVYPPMCQYTWAAAHSLGGSFPTWIILLRGIHILFDIGSVILIISLLRKWNLPEGWSITYAFNPLVILEGTANLHPEVLMVFFILLFIASVGITRWSRAGIALGAAIATKLLPALALPFLVRWIGWRQTLIVGGFAGLTFVALFLPFINAELISHIASSLDLYFRSFEFNASIYAVCREIGIAIKGYNPIHWIGPLLAVLAGAIMLTLAFRHRPQRWIGAWLTAWGVYFFLSTTVHPWYVIPLVALATLTQSRWAVVWSFTALFSYVHYSGYADTSWWLIAEYAVVFGVFVTEIIKSDSELRKTT